MARQTALDIFVSETEKDELAETYGQVIEAVQKGAISEQIKNKNYSGEPESGSVEISRFCNAKVNDQGTARTAGKGDKLHNDGKVTIKVNEDKEIVEEFNKKDLKLHGVAGIAKMRKTNHTKRFIAYLDNEFFKKAEAEGTGVTVPAELTTLVEKLEALIQSVETTVNDFVDGVDRELLVLTVTPNVYGKLANYIDSVPNSLTNLTDEMFHKVRIFSNHRQTKDAICMIDGAVGQLVTTDEYDVEKIPLSNSYGLELFFSKGTKSVMADLIKFIDKI